MSKPAAFRSRRYRLTRAPRPLSLRLAFAAACASCLLAPLVLPAGMQAWAASPAADAARSVPAVGAMRSAATVAATNTPAARTTTLAASNAGISAAAAPLGCAPYAGPAISALNHYEGLMHEHSSYSDGDPKSIPADYFRKAKDAGYAFVGSSEHSDTYDTGVFVGVHSSCFSTPDGFLTCITPSDDKLQKWNATAAQVTAAKTPAFLPIRGFEWTSDVFGHINVYFSKNFSNAKTDGGYAATMDTFWSWFTRDPDMAGSGGSATSTVPFGGGGDGLAHFNHPHEKCQTEDVPGQAGACDWNDYTYIPAAAERMFAIETYNPGNGNDKYHPWIARALDKGWRLSFVGVEDEHDGKYANEGSAKTVTLATGVSEAEVKSAWRARRTYSLSPGKHLRVSFDAAGHPMGSELRCATGATVPLTVAVREQDGTPAAGSLRLFTNGGAEVARLDGTSGTFTVPVVQGRRWYYVRAYGTNGQSTAYVAPVWIEGNAAPVGTWLRGDLHVHTDHSSDGSALRQGADGRGPGTVSVADQIGQGVQNGLSWMPITDHRTYTQHYDPLWESPDLLLIPGEEANGSPHSTVEGHVDWLVQGASRPNGLGFDRLQTSIWDAHSQGANWTIAHPDDGEVNADGTPNALASAVGMNLVEAWNRASNVEGEITYAENRWNRGYRFGMAGASDNHFRELWTIAGPGMPATGVFASSATERGIVQGLVAGRTRIALDNAAVAPVPTLEADFDGDGSYEALCGDEVVAPAGATGKLRITVPNAAGTTVLLYKSPGRSTGAFKTYRPVAATFEMVETVAADATPSWYRVEVRGPGQPANVDTAAAGQLQDGQVPTPPAADNALRGLCSPIFVAPTLISPDPELKLPADAGKDDGAQLVLGEIGAFAGFPDIAVVDGVSHVVAEVHGAGTTHVRYRRVAADGAQGEPVDLAPASTAARFPAVAGQGSNVWVAWADERGGQVPRRSAIWLRRSTDGGATWQPEQLVREIAGRAERPDVAVTLDGKPVVAWQEISAGNPFDVFVQVLGSDVAPINLSRAGKTVMAASPADSRSARYAASVWPSVAVSPKDGRIAVAFHDDRTDPDPLWTGATGTGDSTDVELWQVLVTTRAPAAATFGPLVTLGAEDRADRHANVAFAGDGTLVAAWDDVSLNSSGTNVVVRAARSTDGGATFSPSVKIAEDLVGMGQYPKLGRDASGAVRAVWYDSRSADWRWRVVTAVLDAMGNWTDVKLIESRGINTWPATDGGAIVFASTRNAARLQRDLTQQIVLLAPAVAKPDPFRYLVRENVRPRIFITSELITLAGFTGTLVASVTGGEGAQLSVDGGPFTNEPITVRAGQRLAVRHVSSATEGATVTSIVKVGGYETPFVTITTIFDRVPAAFDFGRRDGQIPGTKVASGDLVLAEYNADSPITVGPGTEYSLDGGATWATVRGNLAVGAPIRVRVLSNTAKLGYVKASIKVGGVAGSFVVRTR